jgi:large subunit ribosomal protein L4
VSETRTVASRTVDVVDATGGKAGTAELPAELFDVTANIPLIHQVVVAQLAAARQGTHATKTRGEVRGGGKKPYRQKGTGRARQGSVRAPQYVGGGTVHGPQPHGYAQRTPKKMIAAALRGALSDRAREGRVHVIADLTSGDVPSTKTALGALKAVAESDKVLVVLHRDEDLAWLSLRNVPTVHALAVDQLNAYDVLVNDEVVFTRAALDAFVGSRSTRPESTSTSPEPASTSPELMELQETEDTSEPTNAELAAESEESAEPTDADVAGSDESDEAVPSGPPVIIRTEPPGPTGLVAEVADDEEESK